MFVFPLRAKNVPERTPYVTLSLIAVNVLAYALTSDHFLTLKDWAMDDFAVSHSHLTVFRIFTALFLHANLLHIAGNMWFLWLFGSAIEGRLGPWRYLCVYLAAGVTGTLLHDMVIGLHNPDEPSLGASGAIMGIAGAYLYAFPYAVIRLVWSFFIRFRIVEWHARWVLLYYIGFDVLNGVILHSADGVGHFAHIGGFAAGFLAAGALQVKRDSEDFSAAQATRADVKNPDLLALRELEELLKYPVDDMRLVIAFCDKALAAPGLNWEPKCLALLQRYLRSLVEKSDPHRLASIVLRLHLDYSRHLPTVALLRLGSVLEQARSYDYAVRIYRRVIEIGPQSQDAEMALHRIGRIFERIMNDREQAHYYYSELVNRFPGGRLAEEARASLSLLPLPRQGLR
jgi:membrane associated rhomboid family serine protease